MVPLRYCRKMSWRKETCFTTSFFFFATDRSPLGHLEGQVGQAPARAHHAQELWRPSRRRLRRRQDRWRQNRFCRLSVGNNRFTYRASSFLSNNFLNPSPTRYFLPTMCILCLFRLRLSINFCGGNSVVLRLPWGTWLRTPHFGIEREGGKAQHPAGIEPTTSRVLSRFIFLSRWYIGWFSGFEPGSAAHE